MVVFTFVHHFRKGALCTPIGSAVDYRQLGSVCYQLLQVAIYGYFLFPFFDIFNLISDQAEQGFYFVGKHYSTLLKQKLQSLSGDEEPRPQTVEVIMGRKLQVC